MTKTVQSSIAKLQKVINAIKEDVPKITNTLALEGEETAKNLLDIATANTDFTQKHRRQLVSEIQKTEGETANSYVISAGAFASPEIKYELYYAEYGAGIGALPDAPPSPYIPKNKVIKSGDFQGYWFYKKIYPEEKGFTNTSIPVEFMRLSKELTREKLRQENNKFYKKTKKLFKGH